MYFITLLEERWSKDEPEIHMDAEEYNRLAIAVTELPAEEQPKWDSTILTFIYKGKKMIVAGVNDIVPVAQQG